MSNVHEDRAGPKRAPTKRESVIYAAAFVAVLTIFALVFVDAGNRLGFVVFMLVLTAVGVGNALIPGFKDLTVRFFGTYLRFTGWMLISLGPLTLFRLLADIVLDSNVAFVRLVVLITWGALLLTASFAVMYGRMRDALFNTLKRIGMLAPVAYSLNLLFLSVQFFATATLLLHEAGNATLHLGGATVVSIGTVGDFFLWHFLSAVPVLKITDTLLWNAPLTYDGAGIGWIVLAFKISVIMPVIAAFGWSWQRFKKGAD